MRFNPTGWVYGDRQGVVNLIEQLVEPDQERFARFEDFILRGGKALSLFVCEQLAHHEPRLTVPAWVGFSGSEISLISFGRHTQKAIPASLGSDLIVRSSDPEEDWVSGESGVGTSVRRSRSELDEEFRTRARRTQPVIVQRAVDGIGIVIDVAYSVLLQRDIIRVHTGRDFHDATGRRFSSATNDPEGLICLYDAGSIRELVPAHSGKLFSPAVYDLPLADLAHTIVRALRNANIDFGCQLEVIIHPDRPTEWHLVQIRPTPSIAHPQFPLHVPRTAPLLTTTPAVTRSFEQSARLVEIRSTDVGALMSVSSTSNPDDQLRYLPALRERFYGRAVLWEEMPPEYYTLWCAQALNLAGAHAQITRGVMFVNTTHGSIDRKYTEKNMQNWQAANRRSAIVGINDGTFDLLLRLAHHGRGELHLVSDGLVGQIYLVAR